MQQNYVDYLDEFKNNVAKNITRNREAKNWSMRQLADLAGVSPESLSNIESAKVTISGASLCKIAFALGIRPNELLEDSDRLDFIDNIRIFLNNLDEKDKNTINNYWTRLINKI